MFTIVEILEQLPKEGTLEIKTLEKMLKLTKKIERTRLEIALIALTKLGITKKEGNDLIQKGDIQNTIRATIRCSSKGYCFAIREDGLEDIYIRENFLNHAWHGDKVLVKISREGLRRRSPEGTVLCVLERSKTNILATIKKQDGKVIAHPLDERILSKIELPKDDEKYFDDGNINEIVDIRIKRYPIAQLSAKGQTSRQLSLNEGSEGDLQIIRTKYNILENIKAPIIALKKPNNKFRTNLEHQPCLLFRSWQSEESPILPALYSETYKGGVRLWVHIPTVSERINSGSKLDDWLKKRSKSICFGNSWESILSKKLINEAGFQLTKVNQAISLEMEIDKEGICKSWKFYLSTIQPVEEINSAQLESITSRKPKSRTLPKSIKHLKDHINTIEDIIFISSKIEEDLKKQGHIHLDISIPNEKHFGDLLYESPGANYDGWSTKLNNKDPQSLLDVICRLSNKILSAHLNSYKIEHISLNKNLEDSIPLTDIIKSAIVLDGKVNLNDEGLITFKDLISAAESSPNKGLIEKLIKNTIIDYKYNAASYNTNEISNDNLKLSLAPWTSPGMNYADIINQQILVKLLVDGKNYNSDASFSLGIKAESNDIDWSIFSKVQLTNINKLCNESQIRLLNSNRIKAKSFREGLISMIQLRSVENNLKKEASGIITGVQSYGFFVELQPSTAEGLVHVSSLDDDWYEYRSRQNLLIGRKNKKTFQIGDNVNVIIEKVDLLRNQIDLAILSKGDDDNLTDKKDIDDK